MPSAAASPAGQARSPTLSPDAELPDLNYDNDLREDCSCLVCYQIDAHLLVATCCGASLCNACAGQCANKCPNCRKGPLSTAPNLALRKVLARATVTCSGCQAVLKQDEAKKHFEDFCPAVEVVCDHRGRGCPWKGRREEFAAHAASSCEYSNEHASAEMKRLLYEKEPGRYLRINAVKRLIEGSAAALSHQHSNPLHCVPSLHELAFPLMSPLALCGELQASGLLLLAREAEDLIENTIKSAYPVVEYSSEAAADGYGTSLLLQAVSSRVLKYLLYEIRRTDSPFMRWELFHLRRIRRSLVAKLSGAHNLPSDPDADHEDGQFLFWLEFRALHLRPPPIDRYRRALWPFVVDPWSGQSKKHTHPPKDPEFPLRLPAWNKIGDHVKELLMHERGEKTEKRTRNSSTLASNTREAASKKILTAAGRPRNCDWGPEDVYAHRFRDNLARLERVIHVSENPSLLHDVVAKDCIGNSEVFKTLQEPTGGIGLCYRKFASVLFPASVAMRSEFRKVRGPQYADKYPPAATLLIAGALEEVLENYAHEAAFRQCFGQGGVVSTSAIQNKLREIGRDTLGLSGKKLAGFPYLRPEWQLHLSRRVLVSPFKQEDYDECSAEYVWGEGFAPDSATTVIPNTKTAAEDRKHAQQGIALGDMRPSAVRQRKQEEEGSGSSSSAAPKRQKLQ
eukprot:CAMPEP_0178981648 /NCGR_PEP_ID=MMETSP0795-20121207/57_1 /TAXON_ID=88552 /ORGANISM="Amoebophrya sp., Strain Ameob2" /LENGTH=679 /DNA_ID=CAMNT_0020672205 /DNA_START=32 /DNA_END=2071 /DNA_ORIENTATION=-